ncbi:MAG: hypothetical protein JXR48_08325 [Candidatus Delongbacteria bacterium]|nr:hypothetical protein [Candidatus Delongbacteria bacterium]MBN2834960.1 hypothetical protein [Candidatus Delongbacteria bacterium]
MKKLLGVIITALILIGVNDANAQISSRLEGIQGPTSLNSNHTATFTAYYQNPTNNPDLYVTAWRLFEGYNADFLHEIPYVIYETNQTVKPVTQTKNSGMVIVVDFHLPCKDSDFAYKRVLNPEPVENP